jgi:hypothetical protein
VLPQRPEGLLKLGRQRRFDFQYRPLPRVLEAQAVRV